MQDVDLVIHGASELVTLTGPDGPRAGAAMSELGIIRHGAIAVDGGLVLAVGTSEEILPRYRGARTIDAAGRTILPGYVDPHTHPVFAATREDEFGMRLAGMSYMEIAEAGGGIHNSVRRLRQTPEEALYRLTEQRLAGFLPLGTTTVEAKSGYGLTLEDELKSLRIIQRAADALEIELAPTFLGAHEIPVDYRDKREDYVRLVIEEMIPAVAEAGLARFCDVFCETGVFTPEESVLILEAGKAGGLLPKIHADELAASGGSRVAAEVGAVSADHLVKINRQDIEGLAEAGVVAVLLPGTTFHLGKSQFAPARELIAAGVPVAIATDFNPGTSMTRSMGMILTLAVISLRMTTAEAICAATHNAAAALGMADRVGSLQPGKQADLVIHDVSGHLVLPYHYGENHVHTVVKAGRVVVEPA